MITKYLRRTNVNFLRADFPFLKLNVYLHLLAMHTYEKNEHVPQQANKAAVYGTLVIITLLTCIRNHILLQRNEVRRAVLRKARGRMRI
jgi:hypothetical protein